MNIHDLATQGPTLKRCFRNKSVYSVYMPLCIKSGGSMLAINIRHLVNTSTCPDSFNKYLLSLLCAGY